MATTPPAHFGPPPPGYDQAMGAGHSMPYAPQPMAAPYPPQNVGMGPGIVFAPQQIVNVQPAPQFILAPQQNGTVIVGNNNNLQNVGNGNSGGVKVGSNNYLQNVGNGNSCGVDVGNNNNLQNVGNVQSGNVTPSGSSGGGSMRCPWCGSNVTPIEQLVSKRCWLCCCIPYTEVKLKCPKCIKSI